MKVTSLTRIVTAAALLAVASLTGACSSEDVPGGSTDEMSGARDTAEPVSAPTVTILSPTPNQEFKTTDTITLIGTGIDATDGDIARAADAEERMLWTMSRSLPDAPVNPAGEGPSDSIGAGTDHPSVPGAFVVYFNVTNSLGKTGSASVTIVVK
jgi:hypothetical protein